MPYNVAMITRDGNLHLEIQTSRKNPVGLLRTSFYEEGKTKHTQHGRITGCTVAQLKLLQQAFREKVVPADSPDAFHILQTKEYGASFALLNILKKTGLDKAIYSRAEPWVNSALAMIIGRIIYAGSKLSLCHMQDNTSLWEICGIEEKVDVEKHCYTPLDKLLARQHIIQQQLAKKHLSEGQLILYDITSSYLEGEYAESKLVEFGHNRDGKKGHEQIVIGLLCNQEGCPVGVEVFKGNTKDSRTVLSKIEEIKKTYGIKKVIFVGDRGMVTKHNLELLQEREDLSKNLFTITALTRADMNHLLEKDVIQPELFDERNIYEVTDPDNPEKRYCLCRNPLRAEKDRATRVALFEKTKEKLKEIADYKKATTPEVLGARIGKVLNQYNTGKYITWHVQADKEAQKSRQHKVIWHLNESVLEREAKLEGCYVITSNVKPEDMTTIQIVKAYKKLICVEKAFRNLKTVQLEIRPIYHKRDDRIRAHVFLCMLAYYVQWHCQQLLMPLTHEGKGKNRRWTFTNIIETLKQVTRNKVKIEGVKLFKNSHPTLEQEKILNLLGVTL
jgi:transposase